ncbi:MAG: type I-C CRISPR-associated protein Cas8c/Csd1 [Acidaminococcaceae bacterium]|nr:type I-C CRISPR-associated protein Cas8c/Csd1 [Acidaminococcaceae bacterium]
MGLFQKACETYDTFAHLAGVPQEGKVTLLPISHIMQKAQIEITLDADGNFVRAIPIDKADSKTVIPATVESAGRSGTTKEAHPLSDQLEYVASINSAKHKDYVKKLSAWAKSKYTHPKVLAVLAYIQRDTVLSDLQKDGIVLLKPDGNLDEGKIAGTDYLKCLIRWNVLNSGNKNACWEDKTLFDAYIQYYQSVMRGKEALCLIEGSKKIITSNHPKGIVAANYGAKLISANDSSGFTYRGRFKEPEQAATISYEASQKAHNALQWIAANQGVPIARRTFICWNPKGKKVHNIFLPLNFFGEEDVPPKPTEYKEKLRKTLSGYRNELPANAEVILAAFDAATTGRLSLTYYNELRASDFYDRIENWYATCSWVSGLSVLTPQIKNIVKNAFGTERGKIIDLDYKILREHVQRLTMCLTDGIPIPFDIVQALEQRASQPLAYDKKENYRNVLFTACAMIRKYHNDKLKREEWTLALQEDKADRSYQYGRLLAVFEKVERDDIDKRSEEREPNAIRLQSVYHE